VGETDVCGRRVRVEECVGEECVKVGCAGGRGVRKMYVWNRSARYWCVCGS